MEEALKFDPGKYEDPTTDGERPLADNAPKDGKRPLANKPDMGTRRCDPTLAS